MPKRWITAFGATLAVVCGMVLLVVAGERDLGIALIIGGISVFGIGRKLDRLDKP